MGVDVRPTTAADLGAAKGVLDRAFNAQAIALTGRGRLPFFGDRLLPHRLAADPQAAFVAERDGEIVGSIEGCRWGSIAVFGPVGVDPAAQGMGVGQALVGAWLDVQRARRTRLLGLETYAQSGGHHRLYGSFGFQPHWLSVGLSRAPTPAPADEPTGETILYSSVPSAERAGVLTDLAHIAARVYPGLDWRDELAAVEQAGVGDTVLLASGDRIEGFAACQLRTLSSAPTRLFVSLAALAPGGDTAGKLARLLAGIDQFAHFNGCDTVATRVATRFTGAYAALLTHGFRNDGGMARFKLGPDADYERADHFVLDSWL